MTDPIDQAIAKSAEAAAQREEAAGVASLEQLRLNIASTGRMAVFAFPPDMTELELFEVIGFLGHSLRLELGRRELQRKAGSIEVARTMPAGMPPPPVHGKNGDAPRS